MTAPLQQLPAEARGLSGRIEGGAHRMWMRVYYEDTDAAGLVYYANYLRFAERARTEMLRLVDVHQRGLMAERNLAFAVRNASVDYRTPARLDDLLEVRSWATKASRVQLTIEQSVRHALEDRLIAQVGVRVVCIDLAGRPARMPDAVAAALAPYSQHLERT